MSATTFSKPSVGTRRGAPFTTSETGGAISTAKPTLAAPLSSPSTSAREGEASPGTKALHRSLRPSRALKVSVDGGAIDASKPTEPAPRRSTAKASRRAEETTTEAEPIWSPSPSARRSTERLASAKAIAEIPPPAVTSNPGEEASCTAKPMQPSPLPGLFDELRLRAELFYDIQKTRLATANRIRSGQVRANEAEAVLGHLHTAETMLALGMRRAMRVAAPWAAAWAKATMGIGEHTVARLLGVIGHPVVAYPMRWVTGTAPEGHTCVKGRCGSKREGGEERHLVADPPFLRSISQLWSYCGHGDPTRRRHKGQTQDEACSGGSPRAKMLVHLMAECCMKAGGPYRELYDLAKIQYADRTEAAGKREGKPWSDGHRHNAALRKVGKEILRDLWIAATKAMNEETAKGQFRCETQAVCAPAVSSTKSKKRAGGQGRYKTQFATAAGSASEVAL
jgi:hypothetical protein